MSTPDQQHPNNLFILDKKRRDEPPRAPSAEALPPFSDKGNGERLAARHGDKLRYSYVRKEWLVWDGRRWRFDDTGEVERCAVDTVEAIPAEVAGLADLKKIDELNKHALRSQSGGALREMINAARSRLYITPDHLDKQPFLFNVLNGTVDLRTGGRRAAEREDLLTKLAPIEHDPHAECPAWETFLDRVMLGNAQMVEFLQRAVGYSLTGEVSERCFFILYGSGANGKSTFVETLYKLFGEYGEIAGQETLLSKREGTISAELAQLEGARYVAASETAEGKRLDEALIKHVTGNETIKARLLHSNPFKFKPEFKIWLDTNHRPDIRAGGKALFDRVKLIPFSATIPEHEQDKKLADKLAAEFSGIFNWALAGCLEWQKRGLGVPPLVIQATKEYQFDVDSFGAFLEEVCTFGNGHRVNNPDLHSAYRTWAERNDEHALSAKALTMKLKDRGFVGHKSGSVRWWEGLALKHEKRTDPDHFTVEE